MAANLHPAIQRALRTECRHDFLAVYRQSFEHQCSRPAFKRIMQLMARAQQGALTNAVKLGREFKVSTKTIQRDFQFLQRELGVALVWNYFTKSYELKEAV